MPVRPDLQQLEKCIDDALRKNDFKPLRTLFQIDIHKDVRIKCSKQFLHKLDDLVCREIILSRGQSKDEAVINMTEDLFDLLMVIYDINDEGKKQVVESFVPRICAVLIDSRVNICIQQETLRKMNAILDKMPQDARKMLCNQEIVTLMSNMGERILYAGDYDLQVGIVEALCRMTTEKQRQELSCQWFPMDFIADAFRGIKDCEFETDCRIFLNLVNGMLGDKRSVFTFPCLSAFLDKYELQIPSDEKLEEFWIDFNLGSRTLSFYIAGDDDDRQWEAVTVPEEKVHVYSVEVRESKKLLSLILKNVVKISKREGKELLLYFDESLDITNVTQKLFGANKYKEFARKQGISVAKTSVHILFDASGSQILVPESQSSATTECLAHLEEKSYPPKHMNDSNQEDRNNSQIKITTPSRKKMSEASMIVLDSERYTVRSPILLINTSTPLKRTKPPLKIMSSAKKADISEKSRTGVDNAVSHKSEPTDRRCRGNETDKVIKTVDLIEKTENKDTEFPSQNCNELQDSQTMRKRDKPVLPDVFDNMRGNKMQSKWACWTPVTTIKLCNDQRASIISDMDVSRNSTKQKLLGSDNDPGETQNVNCRKVRDKAEVCKRNNQQQNPPKNPEQISAENARQSDWRIESETTFKSVLLNKTTEESLIYKKTCILSKDVNTTICDNNSSLGKNVTSHTKSVKELTSEYNSCKLKQKMREKSRGNGFTDAAESLIKQISKRYNQTDNRKSTRKLKESLSVSGFSNKSGLQLSKVRKKSYRKLKTTFINVTSECPLNDVYDFCLNSADEPVIKLGIQEFPATAKEASMDNSVKLMSIQNYDGCEPSLKTKDKTIITSHEKKTLLSDTETECGCDDGKTDISRLQKSKSKRQLIDYSRNKNVKKYRSGKSGPSLVKGQPGPAVINQEVPLKNTTKKEEQIVPDGRTRLPRRATKAKKNYKDLSTSESETEQEFSHSRKEQLPVKEKTIHSRTKTMKLPRKQQKLFSTEIPKGLSKEEKNSSELKDNMRDSRFDLSSVSASASSSPVEALRCIEKIPEREFTQDCDYITKSLSPYLKTTSPEFLNSSNEVAGLGNSLTNETMSLCATGSCSPVPELLITPRHTPTKNNTVVKRKNINSVVLTQETQNCNSYSDVSSTSSETHVLEIESPNSSENHTQSKGEESHAASPLSGCSRRERIWLDMPSDSTHASGHSHHHAHKQMYMEDNLSNSSEEEAEGRAYLLPESPCQIDAEHHALEMSGNTPTLPTPDFSIPEDWHNDILGAVMTSIPIKSDHRREISIPANAIDEYVRQTMEVIEHHLKMLNQKVGESRAKIRDKVHFMLQDEMDSLEKDLRALQDLEKEAGDFGQYIQMKLNTHRRNGQARVNRFQTSLDKHSILFNIINEENIFTSEMHLMKQHMKMVQYNFLKEMHEQEVLYIRRGLYALFRAPEGNSNM